MSEIEANLQRIRRSLALNKGIAPTPTRTPPAETAVILAQSSTKSNYDASKAQSPKVRSILPSDADTDARQLAKLQKQYDKNAVVVSSESSKEATEISNGEVGLSSNTTDKELALVNVGIWSKLKKKFGWGS